ncbi:macoilin-1 isoform X2 [Onthophagus taurus]|nr:macoilin-1 isoform X2 [Onthophagus taurus]XP_022916608.1 macoilin-1 isoform X2 [Onthophagus taurus]
MLCFFFIPVQWLFFAASTYVWVQYVWHTDKGVCVPTVVLWAVVVYLEAAVRLRDVKHMPGHLDLCRPFAAHCIGYPVVTLGFGFKSYIGFRMRQRKQRDVAKENEFYMQLMQQALPMDTTPQVQENPSTTIVALNHSVQKEKKKEERNGHVSNGTLANGVHSQKSQRKSVEKFKEENHERHEKRDKPSHAHTNGLITQEESVPHPPIVEATEQKPPTTRRREKKEQDKDREAAECLQRLELEAKRLRNELQCSRSSEQDLRLQVAALTTSEKVLRGDILTLQHNVEDLQNKLQSSQSTKNTDRQMISYLERKVQEEKRNRQNCEAQIAQERKSRKQEEARAAQVAAQNNRGECTESCKSRRRELENDLQECRTTQRWTEERMAALERENTLLIEKLRDTDLLRSALDTLQDQNTHLENSLSAETRIKLDLFSALGEAKRQLEIRDSQNRLQEKEIEELKSKIAQVLAVMPNDTFGSPTPSSAISRVRLAESPPGSTLDPNATAYTPKGSLVASTEA